MNSSTQDMSKISDGYHTFEELYKHRTVLFASLVNVIVDTYDEIEVYKSWKHSDGTMYDDMFIVGIKTPEGWASYHNESIYWDAFHCPIRRRAPKWDGSSSDEDLNRIYNMFCKIL